MAASKASTMISSSQPNLIRANTYGELDEWAKRVQEEYKDKPNQLYWLSRCKGKDDHRRDAARRKDVEDYWSSLSFEEMHFLEPIKAALMNHYRGQAQREQPLQPSYSMLKRKAPETTKSPVGRPKSTPKTPEEVREANRLRQQKYRKQKVGFYSRIMHKDLII